MITVGLDFGTHQSKVCLEFKEGAELEYKFFKFKNLFGKEQYTLPSIIHVKNDGCMEYGYIHPEQNGEIIRYFKQATFTKSENTIKQQDAIYYSIWYLAFIIFDLEDLYGQDFAIQLGVPTDGAHYNQQKTLAVRLILSAYKLVEDIFHNDKGLFLSTPLLELMDKTEFLPYNRGKKDEYSILVFPEAYACLMPLVNSAKIATGMSLMVDIGGGTTDISFFTINEGQPQVYDFYSISKGLNFLTDAESLSKERIDSNIQHEKSILFEKKDIFKSEINRVHNRLIARLKHEFSLQCKLDMHRLTDALKSRPIIYSGGGSTFQTLRLIYGGFKDIIHISEKEWKTESVNEINRIKALGLCPILSTAYGLSISVPDDNIRCEPFREIFVNLRDADNITAVDNHTNTFSYYDDYDAWK